jgi:hypothetical protein
MMVAPGRSIFIPGNFRRANTVELARKTEYVPRMASSDITAPSESHMLASGVQTGKSEVSSRQDGLTSRRNTKGTLSFRDWVVAIRKF